MSRSLVLSGIGSTYHYVLDTPIQNKKATFGAAGERLFGAKTRISNRHPHLHQRFPRVAATLRIERGPLPQSTLLHAALKAVMLMWYSGSASCGMTARHYTYEYDTSMTSSFLLFYVVPSCLVGYAKMSIDHSTGPTRT